MKKLIAVLLLAIYIGYQFIDNFDPESIKGKNVIITGASTGIGEQLAYHYARLGANIVITARRENRLKEVTEKCGQIGHKGGKYLYIPLDMELRESPKKLIEFAENELSGIDVLVLNHAIISIGYYQGTPKNITDFYQLMNINFNAYVATASYALPALRKSEGSIIIADSLGGKVPQPLVVPYSTAQHGVEGFFGSLREEFIMTQTDISITFVVFGFIGTESALKMIEDWGDAWLMDYVTITDPSDAALGMIKGGAQGFRRVYIPYLENKIPELLVNICPGVVGYYIRTLFGLF